VAESDDGGRQRIDVQQDEDGRWVWSYRSDEVELHSNRSFAERDEAVASARRAFPDVPASGIHVEKPRAERSRAGLRPIDVTVGLAMILLALRNRRRGSRP
jgi:hypothetical protein